MEVSCQLHAPGTLLDRRLGWPQSWSGRDGEEKSSLSLPGIEPRSSNPFPSHYADWATPASLVCAQYERSERIEGSSWSSVWSRVIIQKLLDEFLLRGQFEKFVDSPYYSKSELCGGAVTVSFSKFLPWQPMNFLQRSIHFLKTCYRPLIISKFLASELPFHGWKSPEIAWGEI
jgi:hypothetical protein